jgi:hypothetical protein
MGHSRLHQAEPAAELPGELGIAGKRRCLVLPQVQVSARKRFEIRRLRHGGDYSEGHDAALQQSRSSLLA